VKFEVRVRMPHRYVEVVVEGDFDEVQKAMDFIDKFTERFEHPEKIMEVLDIPKVRYRGTLSETILALLNSSWGVTPRTFREISEALTLNGIKVTKGTLQGVLSHLARKGKLTRFKNESGRYVYALTGGGTHEQGKRV